MGDWYLTFRGSPITVEACAQVMGSIFGPPAEIQYNEESGDPREGYSRSVYIRAQRADGGIRLQAELLDYTRGPGEPRTELRSVQVYETDASYAPVPYAPRLAAWAQVRDAFAALGVVDETIESGSSSIIDDAEAADDMQLARRMRAKAQEKLIARGPFDTGIALMSARVDLDTVLDAYSDPTRIKSLTLWDMRLTALPARIAAYENLESLTIDEAALDGNALRGFSFPKVTSLNMTGGLTRLTKDDLAGFPALVLFNAGNSNLAELDPQIIEVCPKIVRMGIAETPLSRDAAQIDRLKTRWPNVAWDLKW